MGKGVFKAELKHDRGVCCWVLTTRDSKMEFPRAGQGYSHQYDPKGNPVFQISNAKRGLKRFASRMGIKVEIKSTGKMALRLGQNGRHAGELYGYNYK